MGRRLPKRGLSHHFLVLLSLWALSLDPRAAEATARPPLLGGIQTRAAVTLNFPELSRLGVLSLWKTLLPGVGHPALPSRSPSACPVALAPDVRHGPPASRAGSEGACQPPGLRPWLPPLPPASVQDSSFRMASGQPRTETSPRPGPPEADWSSVGLGAGRGAGSKGKQGFPALPPPGLQFPSAGFVASFHWL